MVSLSHFHVLIDLLCRCFFVFRMRKIARYSFKSSWSHGKISWMVHESLWFDLDSIDDEASRFICSFEYGTWDESLIQCDADASVHRSSTSSMTSTELFTCHSNRFYDENQEINRKRRYLRCTHRFTFESMPSLLDRYRTLFLFNFFLFFLDVALCSCIFFFLCDQLIYWMKIGKYTAEQTHAGELKLHLPSLVWHRGMVLSRPIVCLSSGSCLSKLRLFPRRQYRRRQLFGAPMNDLIVEKILIWRHVRRSKPSRWTFASHQWWKTIDRIDFLRF